MWGIIVGAMVVVLDCAKGVVVLVLAPVFHVPVLVPVLAGVLVEVVVMAVVIDGFKEGYKWK